MKKTIYLKFIFAYILFGIFGFIAIATFISNMTWEHCKREKTKKLYAAATQIANTYAADLYNSEISLSSVQRQLASLGSYTESVIWILNPSGRLVVSSREQVDPTAEIYIPNFDPSVTGEKYYTEGSFFNQFQEPQISVLAPIVSSYKIRGYVVIHTSMILLQKETYSLLNISYILLVVLFLLSLIILFFFTDAVYLPLRRIITATEQYAAGNMLYRSHVESDDEMGYLSASLEYMASEIARSGDNQKKFIANVSHDFRSPLTSIRGFLEAMLDGTIPPENHEKYLRIVLSETDRLTKLTNSLLKLNNLNTGSLVLSITDFDIHPVIRSMAASFEQTCRPRNISIRLILTGETLYVAADLEKIQQVLYNLVDNAIKFSRNDGEVTIETTEKHNKVFISIKDAGIGIPKEEQKLIWDRFYKTDLSRGKDKKGTGLGLSIVREIIRAHDENINLISTEGIGSQFIFTLKRSALNDEIEDD